MLKVRKTLGGDVFVDMSKSEDRTINIIIKDGGGQTYEMHLEVQSHEFGEDADLQVAVRKLSNYKQQSVFFDNKRLVRNRLQPHGYVAYENSVFVVFDHSMNPEEDLPITCDESYLKCEYGTTTCHFYKKVSDNDRVQPHEEGICRHKHNFKDIKPGSWEHESCEENRKEAEKQIRR